MTDKQKTMEELVNRICNIYQTNESGRTEGVREALTSVRDFCQMLLDTYERGNHDNRR